MLEIKYEIIKNIRVLKEMDVRLYEEYRTSRLVLEAWDDKGQQRQE